MRRILLLYWRYRVWRAERDAAEAKARILWTEADLFHFKACHEQARVKVAMARYRLTEVELDNLERA